MLSNPARMAVLDAAVALAGTKGIFIEAGWGRSLGLPGARRLRRRFISHAARERRMPML